MSKLPDMDKVLERAMLETTASGGVISVCLTGVTHDDYIKEIGDNDESKYFTTGVALHVDGLTHIQKHQLLEATQMALYSLAAELQEEHKQGKHHE